MKNSVQVSGPMPWTLSRAHSGQSCLKGITAKSCCRTKPSTKTGMAAAAAVRMVVTRSRNE
jgi:hypothetical protein